MIKGFWFYGSGQKESFRTVLDLAESLGCNAMWLWDPLEDQVRTCLDEGFKVFVVVGSGVSIDMSLVAKWKDWNVILSVDDWVGDPASIEELKSSAPNSKIAIGTYNADIIRSVDPKIYDYALMVLYPIYKDPPRNRIGSWTSVLRSMRLATGRQLIAWVQAFEGGALNWAMPTEEEFRTMLSSAQNEKIDGVLVFLPKKFSNSEVFTDDFISHQEFYYDLKRFPFPIPPQSLFDRLWDSFEKFLRSIGLPVPPKPPFPPLPI